MDCQEFIRQLKELEVMGPEISLDSELEQHRAECEHCNDFVRRSSEAWLLMAASLDKPTLTAELEANVIERVTKTQQIAGDLESADSRGFAIGKYALAASVLIALLVGTMWTSGWLGPSDPAAQRDLERIKEFARQMGKLEQLERTFAAPELKYVSLRMEGNTSPIQGYLLYDQLTKEAHFFGYDLVPNEGRTFKLWLLNDQHEVLKSKTIDVNNQNLGAAVVELPDDIGQLNEVVVTSESDPAAVTPSQAIQMKAEVRR